MKKIISLCLYILITHFTNAQTLKINYSPSAILEFIGGENNAIILPIVETLPSTPTDGTILMDKNDFKVKMRQNNSWVSLTGTGTIDCVNFNTAPETAQNGIIIGNTTSNANGVLVLESNDRALVLPSVVNPTTSIQQPYAGMICYDTVNKAVAIFNGRSWSYWK